MPESVSISDKLEIIYFGNHPQRRLILCQVPPDGVDGIAVCEVMDHDERDQTAQRLVDLWNGTTQTRLATATELLRRAQRAWHDTLIGRDIAAFLEGAK